MKLSGKKTVAGQYSEEPKGTEGAISLMNEFMKHLASARDKNLSGI